MSKKNIWFATVYNVKIYLCQCVRSIFYFWYTSTTLPTPSIFFNHPAFLEVHDEPWLQLAGTLIATAGLVLFVVAMRHLGQQYTPCYAAHLPQKIVETGPYRFVRHPVYSANILLLTGLIIAAGSIWLVFNLGLMLACYAFIITREERSICAEFPGYASYTARTGRFFPRLLRRPPATPRAS